MPKRIALPFNSGGTEPITTFTWLVMGIWATYGLLSVGTAFLLMPRGDWGHFSADLIQGMTWATVTAGAALFAGYLVVLPFRGWDLTTVAAQSARVISALHRIAIDARAPVRAVLELERARPAYFDAVPNLTRGYQVAARKPIEVGQCYRIVTPGGVPAGLWEVTRVYLPWYGGIEHACIKSAAGRSETMTLATSVIAGKSRFVPEN